MKVTHLFAGKPQAFGRNGSPSSIIKSPFDTLNIVEDGAIEDEQGNKKLHGGPYMAVHQYAQKAYQKLNAQFPASEVPFDIGTIGENLSIPEMTDTNVFIGDVFKIGTCKLQVVSPRAPCSKINQRYGIKSIDQFIYQNNITGWYYSVLENGQISVGDEVSLLEQSEVKISVQQIWALRKMNKTLPGDIDGALTLCQRALTLKALAPEWQEYLQRTLKKLSNAL